MPFVTSGCWRGRNIMSRWIDEKEMRKEQSLMVMGTDVSFTEDDAYRETGHTMAEIWICDEREILQATAAHP
ncbi:hypothetical protein BC936DRAFT_149963 [Jimgerdemannia flammicorona]|uniref:Uncharacterized protein n=1 Tax=Jimgerdemannia flammicorona TaxID=994334 RepID=A0A433CZU2_9FUNG|nr:hypothetical protein BC936DRAFT_149963 [Jimgerdemannia flammicorona]